MKRPSLLLGLAVLLVPSLLAAAWLREPAVDESRPFAPLVSGTDPEQFQLLDIGRGAMSITDAGEIAITGNPNGYFATKDSHKNYVLRFDWMYERPADLEDDADFDGNSGVLLHIAPPHQVWPKTIEAQLMNRDAGHVFAIYGAEFSSSRSDAQRTEAQRKAIKPVGQWNTMEIDSRNGSIRCSINGVLIDEGKRAEPSSGPIGWQSEGRPMRFRNLQLKPLS